MNRILSYTIALIVIIGCAVIMQSYSLVGFNDRGTWPEDWPQSLEPYRDIATTIDVAHGIQETIYEIPLRYRKDFEAIWPDILSVKTPRAPLTLVGGKKHEIKCDSVSVSGQHMDVDQPVVRILAPAQGFSSIPGGKKVSTNGPWPKSIYSENGALPEYVVLNDESEWIPAEEQSEIRSFKNRARIEIELVVDGDIVDLNRIKLPGNTPIVDLRKF